MHLKQQVGKYGENIACEYLKNKNYKIIERNFYCKQGEIDIIAIDVKKNEIVFIEVKTRNNFKYGIPSEAVNIIKQRHIKNVAQYYLYKRKLERNFIRFDILEIYLETKKINHIKNAFI